MIIIHSGLYSDDTGDGIEQHLQKEYGGDLELYLQKESSDSFRLHLQKEYGIFSGSSCVRSLNDDI